MLVVLYTILLTVLAIYSYALVDPNITFIQSGWWVKFREIMVQFGYYQRNTSWLLYLLLVVSLTVIHYYFVKRWKKYNAFKLALLSGTILLFAYPFLSHDFFNYLFDAKILTFYHQNPYLYSGLDFPHDEWLRFTQWIHRTYPYGPTFLLFSVIPSALSFGKFFLDYFFFRIMFVAFYLVGVFALNKKSRYEAIILATHPLVLIEGVIVAHNDLIALSLGIIGLTLLISKKNIPGRIILLISGGIKYITAPLFFYSARNKLHSYLVFGAVLGLVLYLSLTKEIQPWYFLNVFILLALNGEFINKILIFLTGLLLSYYPYIALGDWGNKERVEMKHLIIISFTLLNAVYLLPNIIQFLEKKKFFRR